MLQVKNIIVGVCGSIAAYKAAILIRLLKKSGANVKVIMTEAARDFITPLTLSTLAKNPVASYLSNKETGEWTNHVELGLWADAMIIAPASANTLAKMANGLSDNLLTAVYLSAKCPVFIAPAMDLDMYAHTATRKNLESISAFGNIVLDAPSGELASGLSGDGRMEEPENILTKLTDYFSNQKLKNKTVLITAGPTQEPIDPVRFISNHSSGKMGYAMARSAANAGAKVIVISGPTNQSINENNIEVIKVTTATEMLEATLKHYSLADICILAAAVADYGPKNAAEQKIKKAGDNMTLEMVKMPDIAAKLGELKQSHQKNIGFALETENERANAYNKLKKKNFDFIVLNSLNDSGAGFGHDTNKISIIDKNNNIESFELKDKSAVANDIINKICDE